MLLDRGGAKLMAQISPEAMEVAARISEAENSEVYLYNGPINDRGLGALVSELSFKRKSALVILVTYGGSANSGYRIARLFQSVYESFAIFVPSYCKSAGTLIATGANRLIIGEFGELGPLDVQLYKRDEIGEHRSGLLLRSAMKSLGEQTEDLFSSLMIAIKIKSDGNVRFKLASEIASRIASEVFSSIYAQVSPEGVGEDYQDLRVALEYGNRLAADGGLIDQGAVHRLVHDYPSHDFVIDKREAATLFTKIDEPSKDMYELTAKLGALASQPNRKVITFERLTKDEGGETDAKSEGGPNSAKSSQAVGA
jgi:hypothetical protein